MLSIEILVLACVSVCSGDDRPIVRTKLGLVRGVYRTSFGSRVYAAFEGIPYAKPPVGDLRFEEPEPMEPWTGMWDATHRVECIQNRVLLNLNSTKGVEDCLYVNVFVPRSHVDRKDKLNVVVHIHSGSFSLGLKHYATPNFLMDRDIILVTFNYRLGIFGFLSTEDRVVPGNNGFKDQVMLLKWVQANIACFGGNPDSVTLTGYLAGAASVHFHLLSPMSKGLFHRGISQSGTALNSFALMKSPLKKAKLLAEAVGCPSKCSRMLVECLKRRPFKHLTDKMYLFFGYAFNPVMPFSAVVEKGSNPFLHKHPYELLKEGKFHDLPYIFSNVEREGWIPAGYLADLDEVSRNWEDVARYLLDYNDTLPEDKWKSTAAEIRNFYEIGDFKTNDETFLKLIKLLGDRLFQVDSETAVKMQAKLSKSPVYYYYFANPADHKTNSTKQQYIFYVYREQILTPEELEMKKIMIDILISFVETDHPNIPEVQWEPTSDQGLTYLNLSSHNRSEIRLEHAEELSPIKFWRSLSFEENENLVSTKDEL